jgi:hypothetical protein
MIHFYHNIFFFFSLLLYLVYNVHSLQDGYDFYVEVKPQAERCFYLTLLQHTFLTIKIQSPETSLMRLTVNQKNIVIFDDTRNGTLYTSFTVATSTEHSICLTNKGVKSVVSRILLKEGLSDISPPEIARKQHLDPGVEVLQTIKDTLQSYQENLFFTRRQESRMTALHQSTASRIVMFCYINLIVMIVATCIHVLHIRNFFRRKKII